SREVPSGLIPSTIRRYISKNYQDVKVVKIEKKASGYEIGLSDGVELKFSLLGQFKGVKLDD
ncbi:MAG: PepSY-like domain-containing protein, partial [Duncaniella sp.]|nr:PepSY-like domain-containing protein [Duncaniella sp.]